MKKALLSFILCAGVLGAAMAQGDGITTKRDKGKGYTILPEAGDWGIGFSADPFLKPMLNLFNNTVNNDPFKADWIAKPMKIAFYMAQDDETYYRAAVRIGFVSHTDRFPNGTSNTNTLSHTGFTIGLTAGIEKIKTMRHRLQGYYGAQVGIDVLPYEDKVNIAGKDYATYGSVKFTDATVTANNFTRTGGGTFSFGVAGFLGVRYFVAPKISLGAEYMWGLGIASKGKRTQTIGSNPSIVTDSGSFEFKADTNISGTLVLAFWF